jgi:2-polyprenyl-3-methyl-5-hydroxy-6-metoxy-1,4-benzoquinol methylase
MATAVNGIETKGRPYVRKANELFPALAVGRILDAGCGDGEVSIAFAEAGAAVVGVDADRDFIDVAAMRAAEHGCGAIEFQCSDLCEGVGVPEGPFDLILSIDVLEHVQDELRYLSLLRDRVAESGVIWLFTPNRTSLRNVIADPHYKLAGLTVMPNWLAAWYATRFRRRVRRYEVTRLYTHSMLTRLAQRSGLRFSFSDEARWLAALDRHRWIGWAANAPWLRRPLFWLYRFRINTFEVTLRR